MTRTDLIAAVREHALANYEQGWDVVVEAWEDEKIAKVIGRVRTVQAAVERMAKAIKPYNERRREVESLADHDPMMDEALCGETIEHLAKDDDPICARCGAELDNPIPDTFVQDIATAERQAHLIAEKVAAGIQQAKDHASTLPTWEPITTPEGMSLPSSVDELHNQLANTQGNLSRYLSGEWSVGLDLELGVSMIRDEAFVMQLLELELLRRLDQDADGISAQQTQGSRYPENTDEGIVCGNCTHRDGHTGDRVIMHHATVQDVRACYQARYEEEQAVLAEIEAERLVERHYEEGF
jgi:DNA-directed RNA polymerase subunit RPC12/RpoP